MTEVEIMDLTKVCRSFPEVPQYPIPREHLLDTIDKIFEGDTRLLVVEGSEAIGKTTLLAQFAKRHPNHTFCLFIKPTSRLAYAPEYLRLILSEQLHWALYNELITSESVDESFLHTKLPVLQRRALRNHETYYFIVDGLAEIPKEDSIIQDVILKDVLPFGLSGFKFLLSGDLTEINKKVHSSLQTKSFPLPHFSLLESEKFLQDVNLDHDSVLQLHKMCSGVPGHLTIVKRMLSSGVAAQAILDEDANNLPEFISIEWRKLANISEVQKRLLAIVAYGHQVFSKGELVRLLSTKDTELEGLLQQSGIITLDGVTNEVAFVSEAHRRFAALQLQQYKQQVNELLINDLLTDAQSNQALSYLPTYYEEADRFIELLDYLSPEHFLSLLNQTQSLLPVYRRTELGFATAEKSDRDGPLTRFSIQMAIVKEMSQATVWRSEIEARLAVRDYDAALALARNTILKEDRLHLLTIIARGMHQQGLEPGQELLEQIHFLYNQLDPSTLGERAIEIASDLIYSYPDLAIKLIESASFVPESEDRLDWAFAHLTLAAVGAKNFRSDFADTAKEVQSKIRDPRIQQFSMAASVLFGDYSASDVIAEVGKLELKNRLFFLRQWSLTNSERTDAAEVVEFALDTLVKDTLYTPKTRDLLEIATPLPHIDNEILCKKLVGRMDSQKATIENLGTSEDYVRLQLVLAQTEARYEFAAAHNRIIEIYWFISNLDDLGVKTDCLAWLVTFLGEIDPTQSLEPREGIHSLAQEELGQNIEKLLLVTAEHFEAARGAIHALVRAKPEMALELANSLNTSNRRDEARHEFITRSVELPLERLNISLITQALNSLESLEAKDEAVVTILKHLAEKKNGSDESVAVGCMPLMNYVSEIHDAHYRTRAAVFGYLFLDKQKLKNVSSLKLYLLEQLDRSWGAINVGWLRVKVGFRIARALADASAELAHKYLNETEKLKSEIILEDDALARTYIFALKLVVRAYAGLLPRQLNSEDHIERLEVLVDRLPASGEKAGFWADLAVRHFVNGQFDICQRIVTSHVRPLIESIKEADKTYKEAVIAYCAAALFCSHRTTALEMIRKLSIVQCDVAVANICKFILRKHPPSEPYEDVKNESYLPSYEDLVDICDLLQCMHEDAWIDHFIVAISDIISSRKNRDRITKQQKSDIAFRLKTIADGKLPDPRNISHQGYKIAAEARIERILQSTGQVWDRLIEEARQIPNTADRALVLCIVATSMPRKADEKRRRCIAEAISIIDTIPTTLDAADRYATLADLVTGFDLELSKTCLRRGMEISVKANDPELIYPKQRRIIDLAHKLDPSYAALLAGLMDNDAARSEMRTELKKRVRLLNLKKEMLENEEVKPPSKDMNANYSTAAWMNLGALNAGRLETVRFEFFRNYLKMASELPLTQAYPMFAWIIENGSKRLSKTDQAGTHLLPIFDATVLGAELAGRIATKSFDRSRTVKTYAATAEEAAQTIVIRAGEREKAIDFIKQWFSRNVRDYIKICDPYFGIHDLEILRVLRSINPTCKVSVLTSRRQQMNDGLAIPWEDTYRTHWRLNVSDQDPPYTEIMIVGTVLHGNLPIHDRWWMTNGSGLSMGTSFNSLGLTKSSELRIMLTTESEPREREIDKLLNRQVREDNAERLTYSLFTL